MSSDPDARHPIEELAEQFLECYRRGERPEVADFTRRYPERSEEIHDLFAALVLMEEAGNQDTAQDGTPLDGDATGPAGQRLGHYRILREVGRGSMGVVYEALQEQLGRFVALKVLPPEYARKPIYRVRFEREARSAARLHHTNIVPVFDVGEEDGTPYFAMQFIAGRSIDASLAELRAQKANPAAVPTPLPLDGPAGTPRYYTAVARVALQIADALAHAHEHGVVHRDVKPANILLDEKGTAWISDFGLAKDEYGDPSRATDLVGTLRYMAPERFDGRSDPGGDVYALGVTLYEMLALRPPFVVLDRARLIKQILEEEPAWPSEWEPAVPRDLETIALTAMAKEPTERYPSARAMADDLGRFLADRPILARPAPWTEQLWRWTRRNPVVAGLSAAVAALLVGLTIVFLAAYLRQSRLNRDLKIAKGEADAKRTEAEKQRDRAGRHADRSFAVIDQMLTRVGETDLARVPFMDETRRRILDDALEFYRGFQRDEGDTPAARREVGRAHGRIARIQHLLGRLDAAEQGWGVAIAVQQALITEFPDEPLYRIDRAFSERNLAVLRHQTGRIDEAEETLRRSVDDLARLHSAHPRLLEATVEYFESQLQLGKFLNFNRKPAEAKAALERALALAEAAARDAPDDPARQEAWGRSLNTIGFFTRENRSSGQLVDAEKYYLSARDIFVKLVADHPNPEYWSGLLSVYSNLGNAVGAQGGRYAEAEAHFRKALAIAIRLDEEHPDLADYKLQLAKVYNNLALNFARDNDPARAAEENLRALTIHEALKNRFRKRVDCAVNFASTCSNQAKYIREQGMVRESLPWYDKTIEALSALPSIESTNAQARMILHNVYHGRAGAYWSLNRPADALKDWRRTVELSEGEQHFDYVVHRPRALAYLGEHVRAVAEAESLLAIGQHASVVTELANVCSQCSAVARADMTLLDTEREKLAERYAARAVALLAKAAEMGFFDKPARVASLRTEEKLQPLQNRADFRKLLADLEQRAKTVPKK